MMQPIRILDMPPCLMIASPVGMFGEPALDAAVAAFLAEHGFSPDSARRELGHVITPPQISQRLGYEQMDYWYPIK